MQYISQPKEYWLSLLQNKYSNEDVSLHGIHRKNYVMAYNKPRTVYLDIPFHIKHQ